MMTGCESLVFSDPNNPDPANASIQSLVTGLEGVTRNGVGFQIYGFSSVGREAYSLDNSDPRWLTEYISGQLDPTGPFVGNFWTPRYRALGVAKLLLDRAASLPAANKARVEGFTQTMIGYHLIVLSSAFDQVCIQFPADKSPVPLVSRQEGYAEAARRLDAGAQALRAAGATFTDDASPYGFRLSSGFDGLNTPSAFLKFNRALRARLAAYQGDYATVLSALNESFIVADDKQMKIGAYLVYSTSPGDQTNPAFELPTASRVVFWAQKDHVPQNTDGMKDNRISSKVFMRAPYTLSGYTGTFKVNVYQSNVDPIPIIRNEELLLLRAEANIRGTTPNLTSARNDLNIVRRAAGVDPYTDQTLTSTNALDRLLYERRYSLFTEGHRWIDMRRFNRLNQLPNDQPNDVVPQSFPIPLLDKGSSN
jgi:hypothetical protein